MYSFTEENYLKAIYKLQEKSSDPIHTNSIAKMLETRAASVTDMVKKLSDKELLNYEKYRGVQLTEKGKQVAVYTVRKHRLWETFLHDKLNFKWDEVHDLAEELEHIHSVKLINKLDEFLGFPTHDPHGDPIPGNNGEINKTELSALYDLKVGESATMSGVVDHSSSFLQHLESIKLQLGSTVKVIDKSSYDQSIQIKIGSNSNKTISAKLARNILVAAIKS